MPRVKSPTNKGRPSAKSGETAGVRIKDKAVALATNPLVAEVVAATLVAAAAALRDPKRARELAEAAADEIGTAGKQLSESGGALWQLAQDVAQRSAKTLDEKTDGGQAKPKKTKAKDSKKKKKKK